MNIHSFESFGTVDGPGVRFVVFAQGCPLRCLYCHNPDTWRGDLTQGVKQLTPQEIFAEVLKYRSYIRKGGVTLSGGEPLMQACEAAELFALCRAKGIHTALDTSGCLWNDDVERLLSQTDLVLLDIKSIDDDQFRTLTRTGELSATKRFLEELQQRGIATWVRHVVVAGYTDNDELLIKLRDFVAEYSVVERVEILPYHDLGAAKYEALGLDYPLQDTPSPSPQRIAYIKSLFGEV
ncbi:MAG: pyruvate formate-lyase-activating protein [Rikenellaceae bacterium]